MRKIYFILFFFTFTHVFAQWEQSYIIQNSSTAYPILLPEKISDGDRVIQNYSDVSTSFKFEEVSVGKFVIRVVQDSGLDYFLTPKHINTSCTYVSASSINNDLAHWTLEKTVEGFYIIRSVECNKILGVTNEEDFFSLQLYDGDAERIKSKLFHWRLISPKEKTPYINKRLRDYRNIDGQQFSWDKTLESDNFIVVWGDSAGTDPKTAKDEIRFDPQKVLESAELFYSKFKELQFLDDSKNTRLSKFKILIIVCGTWGKDGFQCFAGGGGSDGFFVEFALHPSALKDGKVLAHEFTHAIQSSLIGDYRIPNGLGMAWKNANMYECHANFMRNVIYPDAAPSWGLDQYHVETWISWKNTYDGFAPLMGIQENEGFDFIKRMWTESLTEEYPLEAYKRIKGYSQAEFNDKMFLIARRMANYDFSNNRGDYFRKDRVLALENNMRSMQKTYTILDKTVFVDNKFSDNRYIVSIESAPEEYGYNVIPLYPKSGTTSKISVSFKGHAINKHAGWRYGIVAVNKNTSESRYSQTYNKSEDKLDFSYTSNEILYFVVMGAPKDEITTNTTNDTFKGYPKHFRFPYEVEILGAVPEGYQAVDEFRKEFKRNKTFTKHTNGGGLVEDGSNVGVSVYVAPYAIICGGANIQGNVQVLGTALVNGGNISGDVLIRDNAFVIRSEITDKAMVKDLGFVDNVTMSGNAKVQGRAEVTNYKLSGKVLVGGDVIVYNKSGSCDNGEYYTLENYYKDRLLACDGRDSNHEDNKDVNEPYIIKFDYP